MCAAPASKQRSAAVVSWCRQAGEEKPAHSKTIAHTTRTLSCVNKRSLTDAFVTLASTPSSGVDSRRYTLLRPPNTTSMARSI